MANIINGDYFVRETNIGGIEQTAINQTVCKFIAEYEPVFLEKALGYELYTLFVSHTADTTGRYYDIVAGAAYEYNGVTKKWHGLKTDTPKGSVIAKYVYWYYMQNNITVTSSVGESKSNAENATVNTGAYKRKKNWNDMVKQVRLMWEFLLNKKGTDGVLVYPEFTMSVADCEHFITVNTFGL